MRAGNGPFPGGLRITAGVLEAPATGIDATSTGHADSDTSGRLICFSPPADGAAKSAAPTSTKVQSRIGNIERPSKKKDSGMQCAGPHGALGSRPRSPNEAHHHRGCGGVGG